MIHFPYLHKYPSWQRFFAGILIGGILSYPILIYMYGSMYEDLLIENSELKAEITELEKQNEALLEDQEELEAPLIVDTLDIKIVNADELKMDRLITHELEQLIRKEIDYLIGEEVTQLTKSDYLIISAIENKPFKADDFTYSFDVDLLTIGQTIRIEVQAKLSD